MIFTGGAPGGPYEDPFWYLKDPDYNADVADRYVAFFSEYLTHTKGQWAGQPFELFGWQEHRIIRPLFGLLRVQPCDEYPLGLRRIKKVYCEISKKNGKSEIAAGLSNIGLLYDKEMGAEMYGCAGDRHQATIVYNVAMQMVKNNPRLNRKVKITNSVKRMNRLSDMTSFYEACSSDAFTKDGLNPHMVIFDELHAQKTSALWDVMTEGSTTARLQPIIFSITTAGFDHESVCYKEREYAVKWLTGEVENDQYLGVIYGMDPEEDWENEDNWMAVNPSMYRLVPDEEGNMVPDRPGIFSIDKFRADYKEAKAKPYKINNFRRLRLNQWTNQDVRVIDMVDWDKCGTDFTEKKTVFDELTKRDQSYRDAPLLHGMCTYPGMDLSLTTDLTAVGWIIPCEDKSIKVLCDMWMPEDNVQKASDRDGVRYDLWIDEGWITTTPGNIIDYEYIKKRVVERADDFVLCELGYDPYKATQIALQLQNDHNITVVPVNQWPSKMSLPTKEMLNLIKQGRWDHGNNPVLRWMADNFTVLTDVNENIRPAKVRQTKRIDALVASIIGLSGYLLHADEHKPSVYETSSLV